MTDDLYNDVMLRRWSLDLATGRQECVEDAIDVTTISAADRVAVEAKNAEIHGAIEAVEAYEADPETAVGAEIVALAKIRAGTAAPEDAALAAWTWGAALEITEPSPEVIARQSMPKLTPWQFEAVVEIAGIGQAIDAAINALQDPIARIVVRQRRDRSDVYTRTDPLFSDLSTTVGITPAQIDDLWLYAASL